MTTRETVVAAIANAIENNRVSCPQCEGGGRMYADGKAHYYSEGAPTKPCPNCEGTGRIEEQDIEDAIADAVMQFPAMQLTEKAEEMNKQDGGEHCVIRIVDLWTKDIHSKYRVIEVGE
jgi:DnaJ-class molecular chaperone